MLNGIIIYLKNRSPVATAYYKLLPEITLLKRIQGEQALKLKNLCPTGVFDIEGKIIYTFK